MVCLISVLYEIEVCAFLEWRPTSLEREKVWSHAEAYSAATYFLQGTPCEILPSAYCLLALQFKL